MRLTAVLVLVPMLWAGQATACFETAADFEKHFAALNRIGTPAFGGFEDRMDGHVAIGFISAAFDFTAGARLACPPAVITRGDVVAVVERRWKAKMAELEALPSTTCAVEVIAAILVDRFPCDSKPGS